MWTHLARYFEHLIKISYNFKMLCYYFSGYKIFSRECTHSENIQGFFQIKY